MSDKHNYRFDSTRVINPLWTVKDVAKYLNMQPETIRNLARRGEIPSIKIGRMWRFPESKLKMWLNENMSEG